MSPSAPGLRDLAFGACLGVLYVVWLVSTSHDLGFARDEGFYFTAADRYARWLGHLLEDPGDAVRRPVAEAAWRLNHEHPSLMKTLFGVSNRLLEERLDLFDEPSTSYRFPTMLLAGIGLCILYLFGTEAYGRVAGFAAAAAFALQPRTFYHAHLACFDHPVTVMILLVTWAYWRSLGTARPRTWAAIAGVLFGLGLLTKINMLFVPATLLLHYAVVWWRARGTARPRLPIPDAHFAMVMLGVPIFVGLWPWLWWSTVPRFFAWLGFFREHDYYTIEYLGVSYFQPPFPVSYAWGMLLFEIPATILLLIVAGLVIRGRVAWTAPDERRTDLLLAVSALVPILLISNGHSPIFGGSKHFMPATPFLCLFAGAAAQEALARASTVLRGSRSLIFAAVLLLCAVPPLVETRRSHPFGLSHYTFFAGETPGAADIGLCRQFWGFTTGSLTPWLNRVVSRRGAVQFHDTLHDSYRMLQRDGRLRRDIRYASSPAGAELAMVHHEQHWAFLEYEIWDTYRTAVPRKVLTHQGVPIVTVYAPSRRRALAQE